LYINPALQKEGYGTPAFKLIYKQAKDKSCTKLECYKTEPQKCWARKLSVLRKYRRQGRAQITVFQKLKNRGFTKIRMDNEGNSPMYKINLEGDFQPVPLSIEYMKEI
jgi:hypothetical protein